MSNNKYDLFELNNAGSSSLLSKFYPEEFYKQKEQGMLFLFNESAKRKINAPSDLIVVASLEDLEGIGLADGVSSLVYSFQDEKEDLENIVFDISPKLNSKINYFVFDKKTNNFNHEKTSIYETPRLYRASALDLYTIPESFRNIPNKNSSWQEIMEKYK